MKRILGFALGLMLCTGLAVAADSPFTVGDFAVKMAKAMDLAAPEEGFNADSALTALRDAGVELKGDLGGELKEAELVQVLEQLGLDVTTSNPDRVVSSDRADSILSAFDSAFGTEGTSTSDKGNNPPGNGFGRGGKKRASPSDGR